MPKQRVIIGISGSSGPLYGIRLLEVLSRDKNVETHLILSRSAELTMKHEAPGWNRARLEKLASVSHAPENMAAAISSGSFFTSGMVIIPCSMKTLGQVAHGTGTDLLGRAADVTLKERRRLILVPRETPLSLIHLRNMCAVTEAGGIILPPMPAFYHQPQSIQDLVDHTLGKILDLLGVPHKLFRRWGKGSKSEE